MRRNPCLEVVLAELAMHGIAVEIAHGTKHFKLQWAGSAGKRTLTVSRNSHPEPRAQRNARAEVRRILRQDGGQV
jgi:hypothetical protein